MATWTLVYIVFNYHRVKDAAPHSVVFKVRTMALSTAKPKMLCDSSVIQRNGFDPIAHDRKYFRTEKDRRLIRSMVSGKAPLLFTLHGTNGRVVHMMEPQKS